MPCCPYQKSNGAGRRWKRLARERNETFLQLKVQENRLGEQFGEPASIGCWKILHSETVSVGKTKAEICANIRTDMEDMVERDLILKEDAELVDIQKVAGLLLSPLGKRMTEAEKNGRLHREQQFMVGDSGTGDGNRPVR